MSYREDGAKADAKAPRVSISLRPAVLPGFGVEGPHRALASGFVMWSSSRAPDLLETPIWEMKLFTAPLLYSWYHIPQHAVLKA